MAKGKQNVHYSCDVIASRLNNVLPGERVTIRLERGDSAWHAASSNRTVYGPATVEYVQYPDGGVDMRVN